jgi:hypothetical protein
MLLLVGATVSEVMLAAGFTVTAAVALRLLNSAITFMLVAGLFVRAAVAKPFTLMVSTEALLEVQVTVFVKSPVDPSAKAPMAINCWVAPADKVAVAGVTAIEVRLLAVTTPIADAVKVP